MQTPQDYQLDWKFLYSQKEFIVYCFNKTSSQIFADLNTHTIISINNVVWFIYRVINIIDRTYEDLS